MTQALNVAVDEALRQRESLLHGLHCARAGRDDEQAARLEDLLETVDGMLKLVTLIHAQH
jgi:hypothetical protein